MHQVLVTIDTQGAVQVQATSAQVQVLVLREAGPDAGATLQVDGVAYEAAGVLEGIPQVAPAPVQDAFEAVAPELARLSGAADQSVRSRAQFKTLARQLAGANTVCADTEKG